VYLEEIIAAHRTGALGDTRSLSALIDQAKRAGETRGFVDRLRSDTHTGLAVIAEIKRKSPSKGDLNPHLDPVRLAKTYESAGASCMSVLTDHQFFGGSVDDLQAARAATQLPVLRKDFTVSLQDVCDARLMGADCVLLIVAALSLGELRDMHTLATEIGLDVLVETHDEAEIEQALEVDARMIGVNQRDLKTFEVDHQRAVRVAPLIPEGVLKVAESGVRHEHDAAHLREAGYDAILVGETLVVAGDPAATLASLRIR
jgi:indole-3-glycerol phosphate synthase